MDAGRSWFLPNAAIALLASIYVLDITATMALIPELNGKELEETGAHINNIVNAVLSCCRLSVN
jgi:hypothetical protein